MVTAFLGSSLLPEPSHLKMNNIATSPALAVDGPVQKAAFKLLAQTYSEQEVEAIWIAWAPHLAPPPDHPLAGGTLLRDTILQALCTPYLTTKHAREAAGRLVNHLATVVATQTFVAHTAADLSDEEMEVTIHPSHPVQAWAYFPLSPSGTCSITCLNPTRGTPTADLGRRWGSHSSIEGRTHARASFIGLVHRLLARLSALAHAI